MFSFAIFKGKKKNCLKSRVTLKERLKLGSWSSILVSHTSSKSPSTCVPDKWAGCWVGRRIGHSHNLLSHSASPLICNPDIACKTEEMLKYCIKKLTLKNLDSAILVNHYSANLSYKKVVASSAVPYSTISCISYIIMIKMVSKWLFFDGLYYFI